MAQKKVKKKQNVVTFVNYHSTALPATSACKSIINCKHIVKHYRVVDSSVDAVCTVSLDFTSERFLVIVSSRHAPCGMYLVDVLVICFYHSFKSLQLLLILTVFT